LVTFISVSEVLAALGLILPGAVLEVLAVAGILPAVVGIAAVLVPLAAVGLVLLMIGATITHAIRREWTMIRINVILLMLAAAVAWGRLGPYPLA
jgi:DoxX-like family